VINLFSLRELGFTPGVVGMIYGVGGVSSLLGALLADRAGRWLGVGPAMVLGALSMGMSILLLPLAPTASLVGAAILIAQQLGGDGAYTIYDVNQLSLRQTITPQHMLGRVNGSFRVGSLGAMLVGSLLGGVLGDNLGLRPTLVVGGSGVVVGAILLALSPVRSLRRAPVPEVSLAEPGG